MNKITEIKGSYRRNTYKTRLILAVAFFMVFAIDLFLILSGRTEAVDEAVGEFARSLRNGVTNNILLTVTYMGSWKVIVPLWFIIVLADIIKWRKIDVPLAGVASLVNLGLYSLIKMTIKRERPDELLWLLTEHGYSFPSGHTMNSMFCYGMFIYLIIRNSHSRPGTIIGTCLLSLLIFLIGFSRIFCGVHYLTDVLGGSSLGLAMLLAFTVAVDEFMLRREQRV